MDVRWRAFRQQLETALILQLRGQSEPFKALWSHGDDVGIFGAVGGMEQGWAEVGPRLDWVSKQVAAEDLRIENLRTTISGELALTVDLEHSVRIMPGGARVPRALRCTQVCRLEDGAWRIIHRHADVLKPSGRERR